MSEPSLEDTQQRQPTRRMKPVEREGGSPAPPPSPEKAQAPHRRRPPFAYGLLWLVALSSLLINVMFVRILLLSRQSASQIVGTAADVVEDLQNQTIRQTVVIDEMLHLETDMPIDETIPVIIDQDVPINTTVTVPVDAGVLGTITLRIPIQGEFPVKFTQDIRIDQSFHVNTVVPVNFEVPFTLNVSDTALNETLLEVQQQLESLEEALDEPLLTIPGFTD